MHWEESEIRRLIHEQEDLSFHGRLERLRFLLANKIDTTSVLNCHCKKTIVGRMNYAMGT